MAHILEIQDGVLYSSGDNDYGQLGVGDIKRYDTLQKVSTGIEVHDKSPWISAKTGANHSVAIKKDNSIWFWGSNIEGQMALPGDIKYVAKPQKINIPINISKKIDINIGLYFTIISQTSEKSYGFGTFQNFTSNIVELYRTMVPVYSRDPSGDIFLTLDTGPKTIIGRVEDFGYVYSDWSGDLFPSEYLKFSDLRVGDHFTLYDIGNRERLLYKKVDTFQIADGCCKVNAVCMHRKFRELLSSVAIQYPTLPGFAVDQLLGTEKTRLISATDQYGTNFAFNSAIAGMTIASNDFPNNVDPITLKGLYLATGKRNLLDILLFGGLYFSPNLSEQFNINTVVQKIYAREIYKKDSFPPYFAEISNYDLLTGSAYNPDPLVSYNEYDRAEPMYWFKLDKNKKPITYKVAHRGFLYTSIIQRMSTLEKDLFGLYFNSFSGFFYNKILPNTNQTNPTIIQKDRGLPADDNNNLTVESLILDHPYLISYDLNKYKSSFAQNFTDPYLRVKTQDPSQAGIACNDTGLGAGAIQTISGEDTNWLYECVFQTETLTYPTYNIGVYAEQLIKYFLDPKTNPEETNKFFGFAKFELEELYTTIKNGDHSKPGYSAVKKSFDLLRDIINVQMNNKFYFSPTNNQPIFKIDQTANSESSEYISFSNMVKTYTSRGIFYGTQNLRIPYKKIACFTYFSKIGKVENNEVVYSYVPDRSTIVVPLDITRRMIATSTKISYWVPRKVDEDGNFQKIMSNLIQQTANVVISNVKYDPLVNLTKITLDRPFSVDYIIGCVPFPGPPPGCSPIVRPEIYYNKPFDTNLALEDTTGSL
jgi:hypothetical protein